MRNFFSLFLCFIIILAVVPTVSLFYKDEILSQSEKYVETAATEVETESLSPRRTTLSRRKTSPLSATDKGEQTVRVLLHQSGKVITVSRRFYVISVLAKEIDIRSPSEALKAQAVCVQTFLKRMQETGEHQDYDITDNPAVHQSFLSKTALKKFWGDAYQTNYKKLGAVVDSVAGITLFYQGETALAAYHSCNAGTTESAQNYWGEDYPYLQSVSSVGDRLSKSFKTLVRFTPDKLKTKLSALKDKPFRFQSSPSDWIGSGETTPAGTQLRLEIAGVVLEGREIREALGLKSSIFEVIYQNGAFTFTVSGYGHGVGMSQEGAKAMARLGFDYCEILRHYYKGIEISDADKV